VNRITKLYTITARIHCTDLSFGYTVYYSLCCQFW